MNEEAKVARIVKLQKQLVKECEGGGVIGFYPDEVVLSSMAWLPQHQQWIVKLIKNPSHGFTHEATTIVDGVKLKVYLTEEEWREIFGIASS